MKNGFLTSEFWVTVASQAAGLLVLTGLFTDDQASVIVGAAVSFIGGLLILIPTAIYIYERVALKRDTAKLTLPGQDPAPTYTAPAVGANTQAVPANGPVYPR